MNQGLNWLFNFFIQRSCVVIIIIFSLRPCFRFIFDAFRIFLLFKLHNMKRGDRKMSQWPSQGCKFNSNTLRLCPFSILYLNSQTCLQNSILSQVAINMTHHSTLLIQAARGHVSHIILVILCPRKGYHSTMVENHSSEARFLMDKQIICFVLCLQQDTRKQLSLFFSNMFICMPLITVCGELAQMVGKNHLWLIKF